MLNIDKCANTSAPHHGHHSTFAPLASEFPTFPDRREVGSAAVGGAKAERGVTLSARHSAAAASPCHSAARSPALATRTTHTRLHKTLPTSQIDCTEIEWFDTWMITSMPNTGEPHACIIKLLTSVSTICRCSWLIHDYCIGFCNKVRIKLLYKIKRSTSDPMAWDWGRRNFFDKL